MNTQTFINSILALLGLVIILSLLQHSCSRESSSRTGNVNFADSFILQQWRKEKAEKQTQILNYQLQLKVMKDSMLASTNEILKTNTSSHFYKSKAQKAEQKLLNVLSKNSAKDSLVTPLVMDYVISNQASELACDSLIGSLEKGIQLRDSTLVLQEHLTKELRSITNQQTLQNEYLMNQLQLSLKQQQSKDKQNKWLKRGLLILGGFTSSLLIIHFQK